MRHSSGDVHDWGVRRAVNALSAFAFIYVAIETLAGLLGGKVVLPALFPHASKAQLNGPLSDWTVVIAVVLALLFALISQWPVIVGRERHGQDQVRWVTARRFSLLALIIALACFFLSQLVASAANSGLSAILSGTGLHPPAAPDDGGGLETPIMLFYGILLGPFAEELVFRGVIMNGLRRFGRVFAIITSSLLFGFMHGSLVQGLFGFISGLVLGYLAMEYGLVWSLLVHMLNNAFSSGLLAKYMPLAPEVVRIGLGLLMILVLLIGVVGLLFKIRTLRDYCRGNRASKGIYASWRAPWFLLFCLACLLMALSEFVPGLA
ncbi:hypothetical protein DKK68_01425 [Bifidobacterium asteroides]|uniref:CPBP family intramembrane glutamic endopeptidase n=1 Tax=Bifidobacterium asteroides TaxID=1684 RepID=UPI000D78AF39|nr:type II CAAX endopeptidase family protein [Bifidobacterium asteroides]PXY88850.1 hypothetical protein DKK68_01425 [Bifidobacterium asteroides]